MKPSQTMTSVLPVAAEGDARGVVAQEGEGVLGELVALGILGADGHEADDGLFMAQDQAAVDVAHHGELAEPLVVAVGVRAGVQQEGGTIRVLGGHDSGDGRAGDALDAPEDEEGAGGHGTGVAGGDGGIGLAFLDQAHADIDGAVLFPAHGRGGGIVHRDGFIGVEDAQAAVGHQRLNVRDGADFGMAMAERLADLRLVAHEDDGILRLRGGEGAAPDDFIGRVVAAHCIERYPHRYRPLCNLVSGFGLAGGRGHSAASASCLMTWRPSY